MARRKRTPEETTRRNAIRELLQMSNIESMEDIQNLFKETVAAFLETGLEYGTDLHDKLSETEFYKLIQKQYAEVMDGAY